MPDVYELLDESIGTPPPYILDVDGLIGRERRRSRIRSGLGGLAAVAAFAVAIGGGVAVFGDRSAGGSQTGVGRPSLSAPSPVVVDPIALRARLSTALRADVEAQLARPGPVLAFYPYGEPGRPDDFNPAGGFTLEADADMHDALGTGSITVLIGPTAQKVGDLDKTACRTQPGNCGSTLGQFTACPPYSLTQNPPSCVQTAGPADAVIVASTTRTGLGRGGIYYRVDVTRKDGTGVIVFVRNWGLTGATSKTPVAQRTTPPLTPAQIAAIALSPALAIYP